MAEIRTASEKAQAAALAAQTQAMDTLDYDAKTSGADIGRLHKHGSRDEIDPITGEKKGSLADQHARTLQWLLANDLTYAAAHKSANTAVSRVNRVADDILTRLLQQRAEIADAMADLLANAPTLPDGRKVFRDAQGVVRDETGKRVETDIADGILWTGSEPSFEDYQSLRGHQADLEAAILDVQRAEFRLGELHNELNRDEAPPEQTRLEEIEQEVDAILENLVRIETNLSQHADGFMAKPNAQIGVDQDFTSSAPTGGLKIGN